MFYFPQFHILSFIKSVGAAIGTMLRLHTYCSITLKFSVVDISQITSNIAVKCVQRHQPGALVPENITLNEPRKPGTSLVADEAAEWDGKDVVEFFKRSLLLDWLVKIGKI